MPRTDVLDALLCVSSDESCIQNLSGELGKYFDVLTGVVVETWQCLPAEKIDNDQLFSLAIKCLINFCNKESRAMMLFSTSNETRRQQFIACLVEVESSQENAEIRHLIVSLLLNLTQIMHWIDALCDSNFLERIFSNLTRYISSLSDIQLLLNLTSSKIMRCHICKNVAGLNILVDALNNATELEKRVALTGIIKNVCFEDDFHAILCFEIDGLFDQVLLQLYAFESDLDPEDRSKLSPVLRSVIQQSTLKYKSDTSLKIISCEALLQLCSTCIGRSHLRSLGAYFVLRELHRIEVATETELVDAVRSGISNIDVLKIERNLIYIIEQVVDQLICEENERSSELRSKNVREVSLDETISNRLDEIRNNFISE